MVSIIKQEKLCPIKYFNNHNNYDFNIKWNSFDKQPLLILVPCGKGVNMNEILKEYTGLASIAIKPNVYTSGPFFFNLRKELNRSENEYTPGLMLRGISC